MARFAHANAHANTHANAIAGNLDSSAPPHSSSSSAAGLLATLATAPRAAISCVSLSPDASLVYAGTADGSIHEWPSTPSSGGRSRGGKHDQRQQAQQAQQTQQKHRVLAGHAKAVTSIQSAGLVLFSASEDGSLIIWDVPAASPLRKIRAHQPNAATAICFTGGLLYSGGSDTIVSAWNPKNGRRQWVLTGHSGPVLALTASPNTIPHRLFSASADKTIRIWDTENGRVLRVLEGHQDWVHSIALHGPRLYSGARDGEIKLWGALDGDCISSFVGHDSRAVRSLTIAGDRLVSAGEDCSIVVWDLDAHMPMKTVRAHKAAVTAIAASVDGTVIASGSADEFVSVWSFADMVVTDDSK
ncbi:WD40-repeat-containing domain protein [Entophlyctis helioformis]|nr:WD40-repeat-containing domain protein [Entophlyctis helioformis]